MTYACSAPTNRLLCIFGLGLSLFSTGCATAAEEEDTGFSSGFTTLPTTTGDGDGDAMGSETSESEGESESDTDVPPANCGDGVVDMGEECDLAEMNNDAGQCTTLCTIAACGDGLVYDGFEECDDGNDVNTDDCTAGCFAAACGDGYVHEGFEICDDGNDNETDECTSECTLSSCGDGVLQAGEQCDDGNDNTGDECPACQFAFCGDGYIQLGTEVCDDGNLETNDDCISPTCVPAACGDGFVWEGMEECDDGNVEPGDECTDVCGTAFCGDGVWHQGVEDCDDGNDVDDDFCSNMCVSDGYYDDFESNSYDVLPWTFAGNTDWVITDNSPHQGTYSAASGDIGASQTSSLELVVNTPGNGVVQYWYRVSSEGSFDYLRFYIDNAEQGNGLAGNLPWAQASYNLTAGEHTLRWTYSKDGSVDSNEDTVYLDEVYIGNSPP